jgi:hypothetical protein
MAASYCRCGTFASTYPLHRSFESGASIGRPEQLKRPDFIRYLGTACYTSVVARIIVPKKAESGAAKITVTCARTVQVFVRLDMTFDDISWPGVQPHAMKPLFTPPQSDDPNIQ